MRENRTDHNKKHGKKKARQWWRDDMYVGRFLQRIGRTETTKRDDTIAIGHRSAFEIVLRRIEGEYTRRNELHQG